MVPGIDPKVDYAFKRLFGTNERRSRLVALLNAVLDPPPEHRIRDVELRDPFNNKNFQEDKLSVVDIRVRDQSGRLFDIEMQMLRYAEMPRRLLYYWARMFVNQLSESQTYLELRPVVVICFLAKRLFAEPSPYHRRFRVLDSASATVFTEDLELHTIELEKAGRSAAALESPLDRWAYFLNVAATLESDNLPAPLANDEEFRTAIQDLVTMSLTAEDREAYENRVLQLREEKTRLASAELSGVMQERRSNLLKYIPLLQRLLGAEQTDPTQLEEMSIEQLQFLEKELQSQARNR